eukprot:5743704-Pyramimonas_sp.AAC.1
MIVSTALIRQMACCEISVRPWPCSNGARPQRCIAVQASPTGLITLACGASFFSSNSFHTVAGDSPN